MTHFDIAVDIAASPQRVWAVMSDVERWHEWTASIRHVRRLDTGPLHAGSRAVIRQPKLPPGLWTVTALEPGERFTWVNRVPGFVATASHAVAATGNGSRATLTVQYTGAFARVMGWLMGSLTERYLAMEAAGLKQRSESDAGAFTERA